jgi:hypothetical protein
VRGGAPVVGVAPRGGGCTPWSGWHPVVNPALAPRILDCSQDWRRFSGQIMRSLPESWTARRISPGFRCASDRARMKVLRMIPGVSRDTNTTPSADPIGAPSEPQNVKKLQPRNHFCDVGVLQHAYLHEAPRRQRLFHVFRAPQRFYSPLSGRTKNRENDRGVRPTLEHHPRRAI